MATSPSEVHPGVFFGPLLMAHDNDYGWWEIEEKLQMARAKGLRRAGTSYTSLEVPAHKAVCLSQKQRSVFGSLADISGLGRVLTKRHQCGDVRSTP